MVKEIPLTQGQIALVDDEDYEWLNQFKWNAMWRPGIQGYYATRSKYLGMKNGKSMKKTIRMHRLITNAPKGMVVDHMNHDTLDNRKLNLRICSQRQNCQNRKDKTSSKYPGVDWCNTMKKWRSTIMINGKSRIIGYFREEREAAKAYEATLRREVGEELICKMGR